MLDLIILGFILFIAGVAGTLFHDAYKKAKETQNNNRAANAKVRAERQAAFDTANAQAAAAKRANNKTLQDLLAGKTSTTKTKSSTGKRVVMPGKVKVGFHRPDDLPTETQETMTLEDLINEVVSMKKK